MKKLGKVECRPDDIHFFAMKRSGHHAIINWLQFHYKVCRYFSNCYLMDDGSVENSLGDRFVYRNPDGVGECRILSFEDRLDNSPNPPFSAYKIPYAKRFVVVRDAYNCFASRLKRHRDNPFWRNWPQCLDVGMWKTYLNESLGLTQELGPGVVGVNYNSWCADSEYRKNLALSVAGHFNDKGREIVASVGKGSSFDVFNYQDRASSMPVFSRWREYEKDPEFAPILADEELARMCEAYFGVCRVTAVPLA